MQRTMQHPKVTCSAATSGPARLPCQRRDPHSYGHVWVGHDVPDGRHEDEH